MSSFQDANYRGFTFCHWANANFGPQKQEKHSPKIALRLRKQSILPCFTCTLIKPIQRCTQWLHFALVYALSLAKCNFWSSEAIETYTQNSIKIAKINNSSLFQMCFVFEVLSKLRRSQIASGRSGACKIKM